VELRRNGRPLAIGHRGAPVLAPENTLASFEAAIAAGVDAIEFDVLQLPGGGLVLAHSLRELPDGLPTFAAALEWFAAHECGLHVDVKGVGFEDRIVDGLERHGLAGRAFVSTSRPPSVRRFAELAPELPRALTYPEDRLGITRTPLAGPLVAGSLVALRRALPARIVGLLRRAGATVASLNHSLLTRAVVERCHAAGIPVVAWTVDDTERVEEVVALGVDAVVSNDPRVLVATLSP
jgi:glycerophosphoryl diester phosphodiesterase